MVTAQTDPAKTAPARALEEGIVWVMGDRLSITCTEGYDEFEEVWESEEEFEKWEEEFEGYDQFERLNGD
jgi:hypothetical protein